MCLSPVVPARPAIRSRNPSLLNLSTPTDDSACPMSHPVRLSALFLAAFMVSAVFSGCDRRSATPPASSGDPQKSAVAAAQPAAGKLDYNRDVQPILSNYCYHCHGPDTATREPKAKPLRLDIRDQALAYVGDNGERTIVAGKPDESELVRRVESHDPDVMMPQDKEKLLNPAQIQLLRDWIAQGAEFRDHWAFEKPLKASLPKVSDDAWCKTPVDRFILAKLDEAGLKPNAEADRTALIRRVTLDLTGLLPTPEEVAAFAADPADTDAAYAKVVDRLLAAPAYGENRARYWLDYARYGDTHGIHVDPYRAIWPYRDYVIKSFNEDKPFDRFATEQLAGDLMPDGGLDALVATGFVRAGLASGEGGTIPQELWVNVKRERTEAFTTVFMGMTGGCAVCHDHKYDPMTLRDFYSLTAYFGNVAEKPYHNDNDDWPPFLVLPPEADRAAFDAAQLRKATAQGELEAIYAASDAEVAAWLTGPDGPKDIDARELSASFRLNREDCAGDGKDKRIRDLVTGKEYTFEGAPPLWDEYPLLSGSFRLDNNTRFQMPEVGDFEKDQPFTVSTWVRWNEEPLGQGSAAGSIVSRVDGATLKGGWELELIKGQIRLYLFGDWHQGDAIAVLSKPAIPRTEWAHVAATYDGSGKASGVKIYLDGKPVEVEVGKDSLASSLKTETPFNLGRRGGADATANPLRGVGLQDLRLYRRAFADDEMARLPWLAPLAGCHAAKPDYRSWTPFEKDAARDAYFAKEGVAGGKIKALKEGIAKAQAEMDALSAKTKVTHYQGANKPEEGKKVSDSLTQMYEGTLGSGTLICREKPSPAFAHVISRGDYGSRIERVYAKTPSFLPEPPPGTPANRLGLAQWVMMKDNPLTARVTVNRAWNEIFGMPLVESADDFGIVGERPSHPELLDWLAVDFQEGEGKESAWKFKRLYRQLVMSMAYRQSAAVTPLAAEKDPRNRLWARGPRHRVDSEVLRDAALQSAGLLNTEKRGGPSFLGYQPDGVWSNSYPSDTHVYHRHKGPMLYRRSLYQFVKRTAVHPELDIFDATDRLASCARRNRTNTPLAALALMNDVTFLEAARVLGIHAMQSSSDPKARLDFMAQRVLSRPLSAEEAASYLSRLDKVKTQLTEENARKLLAQGDTPTPAELPPVEVASWMGLASILLNTDEFLNK